MMTSVDTVRNALTLARARRNAAPGFTILSSTLCQLEYLLNVLSGQERDRSHLKNIIIGHFAVREFEESDPELAAALKAAQAIASTMAKGLKV